MADFDPSKHLVKIKFRGGEPRDYLPVSARIMWLRALHPQAVIETWPITDEPGVRSTWGARVTLPDGGAATGYGSRRHTDNRGDYFESGETRALGRALAHLGIATEYIDPDEADEGVDESGNRAAVDSGRQHEPRRSIAGPTPTAIGTGARRPPPPQVKTPTGDIRPPAASQEPEQPAGIDWTAFYLGLRQQQVSKVQAAKQAQATFGKPLEQLYPSERKQLLDLFSGADVPPEPPDDGQLDLDAVPFDARYEQEPAVAGAVTKP